MTPNDKDVELKPCPFCGSEASESANVGTMQMVECRNCMAMAPLFAWKNRAQPPLVPLEEKEVLKICKHWKEEPQTLATLICNMFGHLPVSTWDAPMVLTPILDFEETNAKEKGSTEVEPTVGKVGVSRETIKKLLKEHLTLICETYEQSEKDFDIATDAILKAMEGKT